MKKTFICIICFIMIVVSCGCFNNSNKESVLDLSESSDTDIQESNSDN